MNIRHKQGLQQILNRAEKGVGTTLDVSNYKTVVLQLRTKTSAAGNLRFKASMSKTAPNFDASATSENPWFYVQVVNLLNNSSIDGDKGITLTGTDVVMGLEVNTNFIKWLCPSLGTYSAGTWILDMDAANDISA